MKRTYTRAELDKERTPEQRAKFEEKLAYWRKHGMPMYKADESEPFESHADGKIYTSKSEYRKELRARGYEEVGDAKPAPKAPEKKHDEELISDIKQAMGEL